MANIKITLPNGEFVHDGKIVTFKAPCNCSNFEKLIIEGEQYAFVDTCNQSVVGCDFAFTKDALVMVVLNTTNKRAYHINSGYRTLATSLVPNTRKVNGKALSSDITLAVADIFGTDTIPITNGGTGAKTASAAITNLGLSSTVEAVDYYLGTVGQDLKFTLSNDGTYYIFSGLRLANTEQIIIPKVYNGLPVREISNSAVAGKAVSKLVIPNSITKIANGAFKDCKYLEEIYYDAAITDALTSTNQIFYNAGNVETGIKLTIGKNVTNIPDYLFCPSSSSSSYAPKIVSVEFELQSNTAAITIGSYAFYNCVYLKSVYIPSSVTNIGAYAFGNCSVLTIYCARVQDTISGWNTNWNSSKRPVVYGAHLNDLVAKSATVGYDLSKGTIEERLNAMGFEEGSLTSWVKKGDGAIMDVNRWIKIGKYVYFDFKFIYEPAGGLKHTNYNLDGSTHPTQIVTTLPYQPKAINYVGAFATVNETAIEYLQCEVQISLGGSLLLQNVAKANGIKVDANVKVLEVRGCYEIT